MPSLLLVTTVDTTLRAFLTPVAQHFRSRGWRVDGMANGASTSPECMAAFDRTWEVAWSRNPLALLHNGSAVEQIRCAVRAEKYDLVHVHTPVAAFVARYSLQALRRSGACRVIYTAHGFHFHRGGPPLRNLAFLSLERLAGRWTDHLVVINREDEEAARRHRLVPPGRAHYMPGIGIDIHRYSREAVSEWELMRVRAELGLGPETALFLDVAELSRGKRPWDAIQALARLQRPNTHLAFAGDGPLVPEMRRLAGHLNLSGRVHFLGLRNDVPALLAASTALVLPSDREGLPRSVMEGLAMEVPVIGTRIRGTADLLAGGHGLLYSVGDVRGLADCLAWVLDHREESLIMGRHGRASLPGTYDLDHILGLHERLYAEALA